MSAPARFSVACPCGATPSDGGFPCGVCAPGRPRRCDGGPWPPRDREPDSPEGDRGRRAAGGGRRPGGRVARGSRAPGARARHPRAESRPCHVHRDDPGQPSRGPAGAGAARPGVRPHRLSVVSRDPGGAPAPDGDALAASAVVGEAEPPPAGGAPPVRGPGFGRVRSPSRPGHRGAPAQPGDRVPRCLPKGRRDRPRDADPLRAARPDPLRLRSRDRAERHQDPGRDHQGRQPPARHRHPSGHVRGRAQRPPGSASGEPGPRDRAAPGHDDSLPLLPRSGPGPSRPVPSSTRPPPVSPGPTPSSSSPGRTTSQTSPWAPPMAS